MRKVYLSVVVVMGLMVGLALSANAQGTPAQQIQLGIVLDGSDSITSGDFLAAKNSIADAIVACFPKDESIELTLVQFSGPGQARDELLPLGGSQLIGANAPVVAQRVRDISQLKSSTDYGSGMGLAVSTMASSPNGRWSTSYQVLHVISDGEPTAGERNAGILRDNAVANGIDEIDAMGVGKATGSQNELLKNFLSALAYPQPGEVYESGGAWPPPAGQRGWVRLVNDYTVFANTICETLQVIVNPVTPTPEPIPEPGTIILFGSGAAALGGYLRKRRAERSAATIE